MQTNKKIVEVVNLEIELRDSKTIVNYGSFSINEGDFILIKGKNGSGKSTFLKLFKPNLLNYCSLCSGELIYISPQKEYHSILSNSFSPKDQAKINRLIVDVEQSDNFENWESAYSAMFNPCARAIQYDSKLSRQQKRELLKLLKIKIEEYFNLYLMSDFKCNFSLFKIKRITAWSGGQRKMVHILSGLIKAEIVDSNLILLDEPLNNLDGSYKMKVNQLLKKIREKHVAILVVTHCHIFEEINKEIIISRESNRKNVARVSELISLPNMECLKQLSYYETNE